MLLSFASATALVIACGGSSGNEGGADAGDNNPADAGVLAGEWAPLVTGAWTLAPGGENTGDNHSITLDRDIYVGAIRPIEPVGTHHTLLSMDGVSAGIVYASGVGTNAVVFPEGVGLKLSAGSRLNLQLHIYNTSENSISGTSGVEIVEVAEEDVVHVADLFLAGPLGFALPPGQETVHAGTCAVTQEQTIFALFPHMHQLGTHFKMSVTKGGSEQMVHNDSYNFEEQAFTVFEPITLSPGDTINTECTWFNTIGQNVGWGDSSDSEMCFSILYRYPAATGSDFCDNGFTP